MKVNFKLNTFEEQAALEEFGYNPIEVSQRGNDFLAGLRVGMLTAESRVGSHIACQMAKFEDLKSLPESDIDANCGFDDGTVSMVAMRVGFVAGWKYSLQKMRNGGKA